MAKSQIKEFLRLVKKYLDGKASENEKNLVESFYAHFAKEPEITEKLTDTELTELNQYLQSRIANKIAQVEKPVIPFYSRKYLQAAAAILIVLFSGLLYISIKKNNGTGSKLAANHPKTVLSPGSSKAVLTLANGSQLVLDDAKNGSLAKQPGASVTKKDSTLSYKTTEKVIAVSYNTISIPRGGQYQLILADGTKVWLNAASSLRFPTAFPGKERTIELTGEAYFEVAKDATKPFNVKTATQNIQVLGTHFNVNAYADEPSVKTTLLEGSVKVNTGDKNVVIKPGQQAVLNNSGTFEVKNDVDTQLITAWKDGMFQFEDADIQAIMRQVSRWYNVDVEFKGAISNATYSGKISRYANASEVLRILELGGINFKIEGRNIIVK